MAVIIKPPPALIVTKAHRAQADAYRDAEMAAFDHLPQSLR